jgi:colanic acid/amylovoran biosynthesis protein
MPRVRERLLWLRATLRASERESLRTFLDTIEGSRILLVSGAGGVGDSFSAYSNLVLLALQCAQQRGLPSVMVSHGFGVLDSPSLRRKAAAILPQVTCIALREERASRPLLLSLGVSAARLITTGDDAVEPAYESHVDRLGTALGVNLRVARATATSETDLGPVREGLRQFLSSARVRLIPLPIARQRDLDASTIHRLIDGLDAPSAHDYDLPSPARVIAQVAQCRVVLTGAYHAAVFALAQGIPAVCLVRSQYSADRFLGLAAQFSRGCHVVPLGDPDLPRRIVEALTQAWDEAPRVREPLLAAAVRQIAAGHAAYRSIASFMSPNRANVA